MSKMINSETLKEESTKEKDSSFSQTISNFNYKRREKKKQFPLTSHLPKIGNVPPYLYITKYKRLENYNSSKLIKSTELIIDTRNPENYKKKKYPNNTLSYSQYKQSKYPNYKIKNYIKNNKNNNVINEYEEIPDYALSYVLLPKYQISRTLYRELQTKKNEFMDALKRQKKIDKENNINLKKRKILLEQFPPNNLFNRKNNINDNLNGFMKISYINDLNADYTTSEKERYVYIMQILYKLKNFIDKYPNEENKLIHEFLMEHNIFDIEYYDIEKINNLSHFLNNDFVIDPKKNFKENLKDILNGLYNNDLNTNYTDSKRLKSESVEIKTQKKINIKKNLINNLGLITNDLELQKKLYSEGNKLSKDYDLNKNPEILIKKLEKEFKDEEKKSETKRTLPIFNQIDLNNEKLYGNRLSENEYNVLTKKNKLTEYICLIKAKKNFEMVNAQKKFKFKI